MFAHDEGKKEWKETVWLPDSPVISFLMRPRGLVFLVILAILAAVGAGLPAGAKKKQTTAEELANSMAGRTAESRRKEGAKKEQLAVFEAETARQAREKAARDAMPPPSAGPPLSYRWRQGAIAFFADHPWVNWLLVTALVVLGLYLARLVIHHLCPGGKK